MKETTENATIVLTRAIASDDIARAARAISDGASINSIDDRGCAHLAICCKKGQVEMARLLIRHGADPNARNLNGTTPLMYAKTFAFKSGDLSLLDLLISAGADVNARDSFGFNALDYTFQRSKLVVDFLCAKGAVPSFTSQHSEHFKITNT